MLQKVNSFFYNILLLMFVVGVPLLYGDYSPNLENSPYVEKVLRRLDARVSPFDNLLLKPFKYAPVHSYLASLIDTAALTYNEKMQSKALLEVMNPAHGFIKWHDEKRDVNLRVHLSLLGDIKVALHDESTFGLRGIIHPMLTGNIGKLSFFSGIDVWTEYRSDTLFYRSSYQPYDGIAYNMYGRNTDSSSVRSSDIPRGGICYDAGIVKFETAIDYLKCGPAVYYPLTLSGTAPPITYFKADLDLGVITYSHTAGLLRGQKDKEKFIYFHRIGAPLLNGKLQLGINEVIVNGSSVDQKLNDSNSVSEVNNNQQRSWEMVYLIPFVPFKFVEHYAGDRDNAAISFDLTLRWPGNFRWYGEFFLDDVLAPWKVFTSDWGNKWALTCGLQYYNTLKGHDIQIDIEYSHVEPWVYTHFYGGSHRYTNFDKCLGSLLGPNSQAATALFQIAWHALHETGIGAYYTAKNSSVRGGKITDIFQYPDKKDSTKFFDSETKHFLGRGTVSEFGPLLTYVFNPLGLFQLNFRYELDLIKNPGKSKFFINGGFAL